MKGSPVLDSNFLYVPTNDLKTGVGCISISYYVVSIFQTMLELSIQEAFLRFMACLMKGYKNYLKEVMVPSHTDRKPDLDSTNMQSLFDMQG